MDTASQALAIGAVACTLAAALVLVRLHLLATGLDPRRDAVSDYGAGRHHLYYRAMVLLLGVGAALLTAVLARDGHAERLGLFFLGAFAAARIAIALAMTDPGGRATTVQGRVHVVLAAIAFTAIAFGTADVTGSLVDGPNWDGGVAGALRFEARAVAVTAVLTALAYLVPALRERAFGLVERLLYVAILAWMLTAGLHLVVLAG